MDINEYRSSFHVSIISRDESIIENCHRPLSELGYRVSTFLDDQELKKSIIEDPPHFIVWDHQVIETDLQVMVEISEISPETHHIALAQEERWQEAFKLYEYGLYDMIRYPFWEPIHLTRAVDRAAERDYFNYLNEQLKERIENAEVHDERVNPQIYLSWKKEIDNKKSKKETIEHYLNSISHWLNDIPILYFKYFPGFHTLMVDSTTGIELSDVRGLGIELTKCSIQQRELLTPWRVLPFVEMLKKVFPNKEFQLIPQIVKGQVAGIFCMFTSDRYQTMNPFIELANMDLAEKNGSLDLQKQIHRLNRYDESTQLLNRQNFLEQLTFEVSRSRRIRMPISLLIVQMDNFKSIEKILDKLEFELMIRSIAKIFSSNSRTNDIMGRIGAREIGIILPHTSVDGAIIKADRTRKIVESADFSKRLKKISNMTVSIGVSEYPSLCHDSDELLATADQAIIDENEEIHNRVCVAAAPEGFVADFVFSERF